jgi:hypothetical protein
MTGGCDAPRAGDSDVPLRLLAAALFLPVTLPTSLGRTLHPFRGLRDLPRFIWPLR